SRAGGRRPPRPGSERRPGWRWRWRSFLLPSPDLFGERPDQVLDADHPDQLALLDDREVAVPGRHHPFGRLGDGDVAFEEVGLRSADRIRDPWRVALGFGLQYVPFGDDADDVRVVHHEGRYDVVSDHLLGRFDDRGVGAASSLLAGHQFFVDHGWLLSPVWLLGRDRPWPCRGDKVPSTRVERQFGDARAQRRWVPLVRMSSSWPSSR